MSIPTLLIVAPSAYHFGGLATWLDYLDPGLRERGWRVVMGLVEGPRHHRPDEYLRHHAHPDVIRIGCGTGTHHGRINALAKTVRQLRPDILLGVNIPHIVPAIHQCRGEVPTRLAMTNHGFQVDLFRDLKEFQPGCDAVIAANQLGCRLAVQYAGFEPERVFHAPCGTSIHSTLPTSRRPETQRPLQIAWVGRLEESTKRLSDLPRILHGLDRRNVSYHLTVAGSGPDENACREQLQPWLQRGVVTLTGYVEAADLPARVYQNSDVLLITSPCEAGPIVAWEAMAHGVVVVSSRYLGSGAEGALRHRHTALLFDVGDSERAAEQLSDLQRSSKLRDQVRAAGFETVTRHYSHDASIDAWEQALKVVLHQIPPRPRMNGNAISRFSSLSRLDAWCGPAVGDVLRRWTGRVPCPSDAGSEWPHAVSQSQGDEPEFWRLACELDAPEIGPEISRNSELDSSDREYREFDDIGNPVPAVS
jgi:glycosyltransferase involved in cell wall biosynthesis